MHVLLHLHGDPYPDIPISLCKQATTFMRYHRIYLQTDHTRNLNHTFNHSCGQTNNGRQGEVFLVSIHLHKKAGRVALGNFTSSHNMDSELVRSGSNARYTWKASHQCLLNRSKCMAHIRLRYNTKPFSPWCTFPACSSTFS